MAAQNKNASFYNTGIRNRASYALGKAAVLDEI
jgi:hypothetical protein